MIQERPSTHLHQHKCNDLSRLHTSSAYQITIEQDHSTWQLVYQSFATDYDVRDGEATNVGEGIGEVALAIFYCPFCGQAL